MADAREVGEDAAIKFMVDNKYFEGDFSLEKAGHHAGYYEARRTCLDFRGALHIHPTAEFGDYVTAITWSHDVSDGEYSTKIVDKPVIVDAHAFIGSRALLYNCHVKHHGIVACGAVVRNMVVEPYTIVAGNPARVIKRFVDGKWVKV